MRRVLSAMLGVCALFVTGCGTVVPPGKTVLLLHASGKGEIVDKGVYYAWGRTRTYFVDEKLKSFQEDNMPILCADDINMMVDVKAIMSFDVTEENIEFIKNKVPADENNELSLTVFYDMAVKDIVRGSARNVISKIVTDDIRPQRESLEMEIQKNVTERLKALHYPLLTSAILLSDIEYPQSVKDKREAIKKAQLSDQERAAVAEAELADAQRQVAIEQERAKVRLVQAQAQADENNILAESLTPQFLMWRQMEVLESTATKLAAGENNTTFLFPFQMLGQDTLNATFIRDGMQSAAKVRAVPAEAE